jgi:hypothetical protein
LSKDERVDERKKFGMHEASSSRDGGKGLFFTVIAAAISILQEAASPTFIFFELL